MLKIINKTMKFWNGMAVNKHIKQFGRQAKYLWFNQ